MDRMQNSQSESHAEASNRSTGLLVRARQGGAAVLRTCAGVAAGWRSERRGTFLVLVVGVLALLSVIAIVYSAIGVGDRTRSAAVVKAQRLSQPPEEVRDWIASIIAGSTFNTTYEDRQTTGRTLPRLRRSATDYPWTEWNVVSSMLSPGYSNALHQLYTPAGGFDMDLPDWPQKQWLPGSPWLASTEPTWLHVANAAARNGQLVGGENLADHQRDWLHISNIAPDGRYVNLFNLRNNFDAPSGSDPGSMSTNLFLLNHTPSTTFNPVTDSVGNPDFSAAPITSQQYYDHPAYWSNRQVGLFRPVTSATISTGTTPNFNIPQYFNYQYADADGDGMYDSRWQELVNASDPNNVFSVITKDPKYRWFVAARIIDLSSLVNVNTATDLVTPPSAEVPIGTSPAEVDLWRLLTQADLRDVYGYVPAASGSPVPTTGPYGYDALPLTARDNAARASETGYYERFNPATFGLQVGGNAYRALRVAIAGGVVPPLSVEYRGGPYSIANNAIATWSANTQGPVFARDLGLETDSPNGGMFPKWKFDRVVGGGSNIGDGDFARREYYYRRVQELGGSGRLYDPTSGLATGYSSSLVFGLPDLSELLTRRGVNDPDVRSSLETAMAGRYSDGATGAAVDSIRYSPLRENRPLSMELAWDVRTGRGQALGGGDGLMDPVFVGNSALQEAKLYRGLSADVRHLLTTISGARPIMSTDGVDPSRLSATELKVDVVRDLYTLATATDSPTRAATDPRADNLKAQASQNIFRMYADSLLGDSWQPTAWDSNSPLRTLFYGYNGPEKAAYAAAFSAINMQQMALKGSSLAPTKPYTLILSEDGRNNVRSGGPALFPEAFGYNPDGSRQNQIFGNQLDMDVVAINSINGTRLLNTPSRLAPAAATSRTPLGAATVYPAEPQPFITAVSCFTVYTDAPQNAGGDVDFGVDTPGPTPTYHDLTIRPGIHEENSDFLFRVVAFQLTNPSNVEIKLSSDDTAIPSSGPGNHVFNMRFLDIGHNDYPPMDQEQDFDYITYGNRTFKLVALSEGTALDAPDALESRRYFDDETLAARQLPGPSGSPSPGLADATAGVGTRSEAGYVMMPVDATGDYVQGASNGGIGVTAQQITMRPGETIVCYALSQAPQTILSRFAKVEHTGSQTANDKLSALEKRSSKTLRAFFRSQYARAGVEKVYWIPEYDGVHNVSSTPVRGTGYAGSYNDDPNTADGTTARFETYRPAATPGVVAKGLKAFGQLMQKHDGSTAAPLENQVVMLFRTRRFGLEGAPTPVTVPDTCWDLATPFGASNLMLYPRNNYDNDQLLDRFHMPVDGSGSIQDVDSRLRRTAGSRWDEPIHLPTLQGNLENTPNPGPIVGGEGYDSGVTVLMAAWATRPCDPSANGGKVPVGAVPAYCLEPKNAAAAKWNVFGIPSGASANFSQYPGLPELNNPADPFAGVRPRTWLKNAGGGISQTSSIPYPPGRAPRPVSAKLRSAPTERWDSTDSIDAKDRDGLLGSTYRTTAPSYTKNYPTLNALEYTATLAGLTESGNAKILRNLRKLRPTDALLPLAVGGIHAPSTSGTPNVENDWVTLGEMLAVSMGYDTGAAGATVYDLFRPELPDTTKYPTDTPPRPFSSGNLVLDDYVPFKMTSARTGPVTFDPTRDVRYGLQIPLALTVLDKISTSGVGSLTEMEPGKINANTMPQMVSRVLPLMAPNTARVAPAPGPANAGFEPKGPDWAQEGLPPESGKKYYWWGQNGPTPARIPTPGGGANDFTADLPAEIDITAALISYRDKGEAYLGLERVFRYNSSSPAIGLPVRLNAYDPSGQLDGAVDQRTGRSRTTLIDGINEQPGFKSLGEILCARNRGANPSQLASAPDANNRCAMPYNIDALGYDVADPTNRNSANVNNSFVGIDWAVKTPTGGTNYPTHANGASLAWEPNRFGNEQGEKLMLASGALGSLTVRSDVFAVWFILHGYQRTDCEGLGPSDPLTPSIARRFMMVVDRSNVVKKGDSPKILLFKEVPLN